MARADEPLKTIKVENPDKKGGFMIINRTDFDPKKHKRFVEKKLSALKVEELRSIALDRGIDGADEMKRADLLAALEESDEQ